MRAARDPVERDWLEALDVSSVEGEDLMRLQELIAILSRRG